MKRALTIAVIAAGLTAGIGHAQHAQAPLTVARTERGITVHADAASIRQVLARLAMRANLVLDIRGDGDHPVTAHFEDVAVADAIGRLLKTNYLIAGDKVIVYLPVPDRSHAAGIQDSAARRGARGPHRSPSRVQHGSVAGGRRGPVGPVVTEEVTEPE